MNDKSTDIQVWFLRHGKTPFDYENSEYDDFMDMLCNGQDTPLLKQDHRINFKTLPDRVEFVAYSPAKRAVQTAEVLRDKLGVMPTEELEFLREVRFDKKIILRHEYKNLAGSRKDILKRWYDGSNKAETFEDSLARVRKIEAFLRERQEKTIILVTHGWFLRLLENYFVQGNHTPTFDDLLKAKPVLLGHCIKATVTRKNSEKPQMEELELVATF
jgi:broad specificity phosphatase PhoE